MYDKIAPPRAQEMEDIEDGPSEMPENEFDENMSDNGSDVISDNMEHNEMSDTENNEDFSPERQKQLDVQLIKLLVGVYLPVTIVEGGLSHLMINTKYVMPTRKALTKKILPEMYKKSLEEQISIVEQGAETICLSVDRWMSVKNEEPVIAITAHFITPDYKFKSVFLKCWYCERNSEGIQFFLKEMCFESEWKIAGKINWCVTDNGADMVDAVNSLGWNQRSCMAFKLNLALQNSFKLCEETLSKVKEIVSYFEDNYQAVKILDAYLTEKGIVPMELLLSVPTSWTTTYDMIERFLTLQDAIKATLAQRNDSFVLPDITNEDWIKLEKLCKVFKPFKEATKELLADKYAPASKEIAIVNGLKDVIQELRKRPDCYNSFEDVVKCIEKELEERFDGIETEPNLAMCTILDPRYKMSMFLDESAANMAKLNLISEVEQLLKDGKDSNNLSMAEDGQDVAKNENEEEFSLWRRRNIILESTQSNTSVNKHTLAQLEVESYMLEDLTDTDPCKWWQNKESKYPHLAKLFRTRCNKVATSVPSEELFTERSMDLRDSKEMLSQSKADMIMFLHNNLDEDDYVRLMPEIGDDLRMMPV